MKPTRTFSATDGQRSTGTAGADAIERDIDSLCKALDPLLPGGGIGAENIKDDSFPDSVIGNRVVDDALSGGGDTGTLTELLSWLARGIKAITGKGDWYTLPTKSIDVVINDMQGLTLGQIPDGTVTKTKLHTDLQSEIDNADIITDITTAAKYKWKVNNGSLYIEEVG